MKAIHLQVEYLNNPIGIDIKKPRFYWNCEGGTSQTAYHIIASIQDTVIWDSGKVVSSSMSHITYEGRELQSREVVTYKIRLWDENDVVGEWAEGSFEMGLLEPRDWKATWITGNVKIKKHMRYPVDYFLKEFTVNREIVAARLYITACGVYEAHLNGVRVGDFALAPGCTDYRKRLQYQTYDVTELLQQNNQLEVAVGDGWYRGSLGCFGATNVYGRQTKLLFQLVVDYKDGTCSHYVSNKNTKWSNDGPIRFSDLKDGEIYEAGRVPSYDGQSIEDEESMSLVASNNVIPKEMEHFRGKLLTTPSGKKVIDFGQNIAGFVGFKIKGKKGQTVRLLLGEILNEKGEFTQKNFHAYKPKKEFGKVTEIKLIIGMAEKLYQKSPEKMQPTPKQEIQFTCSGGLDYYKTRFAVFGFRYVLIGTEVPFQAEDFEAIAVYSDMERTGYFSCSNPKVNQLFENTVWSMKGNFLDIPTDCPTRERLGWTGDAQVFFDTGAYIMNTASFFRKWMIDLEDSKMKNGVLPAVAPYTSFELMYNNTGGSVGWGDAAVYLPYRYWKRFGDRNILEQTYPMARSYAMFAISNTGFADKKKAKEILYNKYVYEKGRHLGEWLEPVEFNEAVGVGTQLKQIEVATAYFHYSMKCMSEIACELGKTEDEKLFGDYAKGSKEAYQKMFLDAGVPDTDRQAKLVRPLALRCVSEEQRPAMEARLAKAVENRDFRIATGFLSTPFVLPVLTEAGYLEHAYRMLENELAPGWLHEVNEGATTVWEDWEGTVSHNHYSPGAVCQWLFDTVGGISVAGENQFVIAPQPGGTLREAIITYQSLYGIVKSAWKRNEHNTIFEIFIPANTKAKLILPDGKIEELTSGEYQFSI